MSNLTRAVEILGAFCEWDQLKKIGSFSGDLVSPKYYVCRPNDDNLLVLESIFYVIICFPGWKESGYQAQYLDAFGEYNNQRHM